MNVLIQNPTTFFPSLEAATKVAVANNLSELGDPEGWTYLPMALPNGRAKVMVVDQDDVFLGYL
jgi:hypothetical protein